MSLRILSGNALQTQISADDRGLNYGDGVFETLLVHEGQLVWWREHWDRLLRGAQVLGIPEPDEMRLRKEAEFLVAGEARAVLKIVLTRGVGGRGYATSPNAVPTVVLSRHAAPARTSSGLNVCWCRTALAIQPALAGIKHLNRLEQVLARAEWNDPLIHEGMMCDTEGLVVGATSANVFARVNGRWLTPKVNRCGIAGVARAWLLEHLDVAAEVDLRPFDLRHAEAIFLCNSVRGILPVTRLADKRWEPSAEIEAAQQLLGLKLPAFERQE